MNDQSDDRLSSRGGFCGDSDAFFADLRQRTVQVHGGDDGVFDTGFVAGASHRPYFITRPVALWLEKHLDLPNWTAESLAAVPTTHIAEWSQKHNIHMDKLYATEQQEGGTDALGNDIPGYQREDLSVFTPEQWRCQKQRLVFETWVEAARSGVQQLQRTSHKTTPE